MFIFRLFFVFTVFLLNSCAGSPNKPDESDKSAKSELTKSIAPFKVAKMKEKSRQKEANTSIDPDVMYMLMAAEIAGQRDQYDVALEGYMEAAKRANDPRFAERAAVIAMYMKDNPKTQEAVSLWLKHDTKNLTARKIAALTALRANNQTAAVEHLSALLQTDIEGFENTMLEIAAVLQKENKLPALYDSLTILSKKQTDQAIIHLIQALLAVQEKNFTLADQHLQQSLKIKPNWDKALVLQAQIAMLSGDTNKAKNAIKTASAKHPNNDKIKKLLAQLLIKTENYKEAGDIYRQLVAKNPKDTESEFTLGLVYLQLEQYGKAEEVFSHLLEQPDWQDRASFYLGKIAQQNGQLEQALEWYDNVSDGEFAFDAGLEAVSLLAKDKQFEPAHARLNKLSEQFPKQKQRILLIQAEIYNQQKQYQKAFDLVTNALNEQPDQQELLYTRALIAERLNKKDVTEQDLKKILEKNPNNVEALNALGYSLLDNPSRYAEAEDYLKKALQLRPNEAVIIDSYGWLKFKLGKHQEALDYLQQAYAKQQENEIAAHIAEALWVLGRKEEAKKFFDKVIKNAPDDEYLLEFQRRILNNSK